MSSCHFWISVKTTARNIYTVPAHNKHIFVRAKRVCLLWESAYYECAYNEWAQYILIYNIINTEDKTFILQTFERSNSILTAWTFPSDTSPPRSFRVENAVLTKSWSEPPEINKNTNCPLSLLGCWLSNI